MLARRILTGIALGLLAGLLIGQVHARDDGRFAGSPLKPWYEAQHNKHGLYCCSEADAQAFYGDYTLNTDGSVEFDADGSHHTLPDWMVLDGPNPTGHAVWWHAAGTDFCFALGTTG